MQRAQRRGESRGAPSAIFGRHRGREGGTTRGDGIRRPHQYPRGVSPRISSRRRRRRRPRHDGGDGFRPRRGDARVRGASHGEHAVPARPGGGAHDVEHRLAHGWVVDGVGRAAQRRHLRRVRHLAQAPRESPGDGDVESKRGEERRAARRRLRGVRARAFRRREGQGRDRDARVSRRGEKIDGCSRGSSVKRASLLGEVRQRAHRRRRRRRARRRALSGVRPGGSARRARRRREPRHGAASVDERARRGGAPRRSSRHGERQLPRVRIRRQRRGSVRHEHLQRKRLAEQTRVLGTAAEAGEEKPEDPHAKRARLPAGRQRRARVVRPLPRGAPRAVEHPQKTHRERVDVERRATEHRALRWNVGVARGVERDGGGFGREHRRRGRKSREGRLRRDGVSDRGEERRHLRLFAERRARLQRVGERAQARVRRRPGGFLRARQRRARQRQ